MKKIALTGVMGAGKSSVIRILKQLDIPVFDCDAINGELLQKGAKGHAALVRTYGDAVLDAQGNIDRSALSDLMFAKGKKQEVEALLHPLIKQRLLEAMSACARPLVVAEVPLLFEVGWQDAFDGTWVVA
ncbi:MAG: dephospho-CoA kinase [Merdibacter sp.]